MKDILKNENGERQRNPSEKYMHIQRPNLISDFLFGREMRRINSNNDRHTNLKHWMLTHLVLVARTHAHSSHATRPGIRFKTENKTTKT